MQIIDCDQGTDEWRQARIGIPTASVFATVMAKGRDGGASKTRRELLCRLAGEIVTGELSETYQSPDMARGQDNEAEAVNLYAFMRDCDPKPVGFIRNGRVGCSPDRLVGISGLLEVKNKAPHRLIEAMLRDDAPPEHAAQLQGQLWVSEREWNDLCCYWRGMPLVVHRVGRDEAYIANLSRAIDAFNEELDLLVERVRAYGNPGTARDAFRASAAAAGITAEMMATGTLGG